MTREFPKNPEPQITRPTVGRIVHVFGLVDFGIQKSTPRAAIVAFVDPIDDLVINVGVWNTDGSTGPVTGLKHASLPRHPQELYWDWMDYQKGQAAKTEALERDLGKLQSSVQSSDDGKR